MLAHRAFAALRRACCWSAPQLVSHGNPTPIRPTELIPNHSLPGKAPRVCSHISILHVTASRASRRRSPTPGHQQRASPAPCITVTNLAPQPTTNLAPTQNTIRPSPSSYITSLPTSLRDRTFTISLRFQPFLPAPARHRPSRCSTRTCRTCPRGSTPPYLIRRNRSWSTPTHSPPAMLKPSSLNA